MEGVQKSVAEGSQEVFDAAIAAEEAGYSAKALRLYEKASDINPAAYPIGLRWASLLYDEARWKEAIRVARQMIRKRPQLYSAHWIIARSNIELGRWSLAERMYRESLAIKQSPTTWVLISSLPPRRKRNDEAEECLRKALKVDPDYEEAHYHLGYIYRLKGKFKLAEKHLR